MSIPESATSSALECSNNNGRSESSSEGESESSFDLASLHNGGSLGSSRDSRPPRLYTPVTNMQKRSMKVLGASVKNNEEGRKLADELNKNVKLLIERSRRSEERLTLVKTIAIKGCILFLVELSPPPEATTIEQDVLAMLECLPNHLQHNEMVVTFPCFSAVVRAKTVTEIRKQDSRKKTSRYGARNISVRNDLPLQCTSVAESHEVELIEPPCASNEHTNLTIYTRASCDSYPKRVVVEVGNTVIHDQTITTGTSYIKVKVLAKSGSITGSVRVVQTGFQNQPLASDRAKFLFLAEDIAAEFNRTYQTKVMETCRNRQTSPSSRTIRSFIWLTVMKPLQDDLDFLLSQDSIEVQRKIQNSKKARDFYIRLIDKIFTFFTEESMWKSLSYFRRQILDQLGLHHDNGRGFQVQLLTSLNLDQSSPHELDFHGELETKSLKMGSEKQLLLCSSVENSDEYSTGCISFNSETNPVLSN